MDNVPFITQRLQFIEIQKRARNHGKGVYNISIGVVKPVQEPSVSLFRDTINAFQANDNVIMHLPTSKHVENVDDKTDVLETPVKEFDLAYLADYLIKKRSLISVSDDVVKICRDGLDSSDWTSFPAPGLPLD